MIPLKRDRHPDSIHSNFHPESQAEFSLELMVNQREIRQKIREKHNFSSSRWKHAKPQLLKETHNKCAYCEAPTAMVAYGDVEHYRPKSTYWWLAYCYDNYLASCQICNQKYKKARFPVKNDELNPPARVRSNSTDNYLHRKKFHLAPNPMQEAKISAFEVAHKAERPYIVNPYVDAPETWFAWQAFDTLRQVKIVPAPGVDEAEKYVQAAENDLGLNRIELAELRFGTYQMFKTYKMILKDPGLSDGTRTMTQLMVNKMLEDSSPFAGMLRYFDCSL